MDMIARTHKRRRCRLPAAPVLLLAGLLVLGAGLAAAQDPGLEIQRRIQEDTRRIEQERDLRDRDFQQRQRSEALRQDENRQQQMQQDLRRSDEMQRRTRTDADADRLRLLNERRADEARQRQIENERRQIDRDRRQLENDRRRLEIERRLDSVR